MTRDAVSRLARLRQSAAQLADQVAACGEWSGRERAEALSSLDLLVAALTRVRADLLVAERNAGTSQRPGDRSFEAARARISRTGAAEATREVRQADALVSMPTVAAAVGDGRVPLGHLDTLARVAATAAPEVAQLFRSAEMQATVVQLAVAQSAPDFARSLAQLAASRDPQALEDTHEAVRRERSLVLSHRARGTYLKGFLDRVAGEALQVALDSTGQVPDGTRSPEQARADALVALARRACAGMAGGEGSARRRVAAGSDVPAAGAEREVRGRAEGVDGAKGETGKGLGASSRPHVSLIVPVETFAALRNHHRDREAARSGDDWVVEDAGQPVPDAADQWSTMAPVPPATLEDGTPVAMSELAQALCDCEITRIVMSAEGVPVDLGRTRRTYSGVHRRAVVARDRQCAWNGCHASARWSQVHHIRWWDRDRGSTSIENGVLLCDYHHHEVHRLDLTIERHAKPPGHLQRRRASDRLPEEEPPFAPMRYTFRRRRDGRTVSAPERNPSAASP
ncbi:HNH endonuclease signature motif containing protein [Cellulomonas terrae]|nr:HNH endonuclease signature motif containing protein [Cellulomonas terrae]